MGYKGELGYETFLHGSQTDLRKIFIFLLEKLPKIKEQPLSDSIGNFKY